MRTHVTQAGDAAAGRSHARHARRRYLEFPAGFNASPEITHEQIARRAYELYLARGDREGDALGDWLAAERDLRAAAMVFPPLTKHTDPDAAH